MKRRILTAIIVLMLGQILQAQNDLEKLIEQYIENNIESSEEGIEETELYERLIELAANPINLNCKKLDILRELKLINGYQYFRLLEHINLVGSIQSLQELKFIEGFSIQNVELLKHFVKVGECKETKNRLFRPRHEFTTSYQQVVQKQAGFEQADPESFLDSPNKYYVGSPFKLQSRYSFKSGEALKAGFIAEKDAGEVLFKSRYKNEINDLLEKGPTGFDYLSAYIQTDQLLLPLKLIIGDYHLQFGQGLTMWSNLAFGKSATSTAIKRYARGISPNTSANENHFFRGIAMYYQWKGLELNLFYSNKKRDGNVLSGSTFSSFQHTGLHRTINELEDKNAIGEKMFGGYLSYTLHRFKLGITAYKQSLDKMLLVDDQLYKKYNFSGNENACYGIDYQINFNKMEIFGEVSMSQNKAKAILTGFTYYFNAQGIFHFHYRNYPKDFQNLYADALSENSNAKNEEAFYTGVEIELHPKWKASAYMDWFRFPWLKSGVDGASHGNEQLLQLDYKHSSQLNIYARFKSQQKEKNHSYEEDWSDYLVPEVKQSLRLHFNLEISKRFECQCRAEWQNYKFANEKNKGFLIFQELNYAAVNNRLKTSFRYTTFNTKDYDSRIYVYEKDIRYAFSIPSFYGKGNRFYLMMTYKIKDKITTRFKFSQTHYHDRENIGSGLDLIKGNKKTEVKFQIQFKL